MRQISSVTSSTLLIGMALAIAACGGSEGSGDVPESDTPRTAAAADSGATDTPAMGADMGAINQQLAARGEQLFTEKICNTCHSIGSGRLVGPDLNGVTERRTREWILHMIMRPDSMIQADSIAHRLFGEYMTPMVNQNLSRDNASALYEYLRSKGSAE
jgi:mono/diheme cytochrome c family protein